MFSEYIFTGFLSTLATSCTSFLLLPCKEYYFSWDISVTKCSYFYSTWAPSLSTVLSLFREFDAFETFLSQKIIFNQIILKSTCIECDYISRDNAFEGACNHVYTFLWISPEEALKIRLDYSRTEFSFKIWHL